jgi:hypothetical protein
MCDIYDDDEPNILFFRGVIPEKYDIETLFTNKIMDELNMDKVDTGYEEFAQDTIPPTFTDMDNWPKMCNITCWWCHRKFKDPAVFVPSSIALTGTMTPHGCFCSFPCAASYIDTFIEIKFRWEKHKMLLILYNKMTGKNIDFIHKAPRPYNMIQYGKNAMSSNDYTALLKTLS